MKTIYLIRHGETDYNREGRVQGSGIDTSLNDLGRLQAQAFHNTYKHIPFDKVFTSALKRSQETVKYFIESGIPHIAHEGLNEISWGNHEGKLVNDLDGIYFRNLIDYWKSGATHIAIRGGESPDQVAIRQMQFIKVLLSAEQEKTVLICMHGRAMKIFNCILQGLPLSEMDNFEHSNTCLYVYQYSGGLFHPQLSNCTKHLIDIKIEV